MKKIIFSILILFTANFSNADLIINQDNSQNYNHYSSNCYYNSNYVVKARGCGTPICFGTIQCGVRTTAVSCIAFNGRCPTAQQCLDDPNVTFDAPTNVIYNATSPSSNGAPIAH